MFTRLNFALQICNADLSRNAGIKVSMSDNQTKKEELNKDEIKNEMEKAQDEKKEAIDEKKEIAETKKEQPKKAHAVQDGIDIFDDSAEINFGEEKSGNAPEIKGESKKKAEKSDKKAQKGSKKKKKKKKEIKKTSTGRAYIQASYNNTIVALTDQNGNTLAVGSSGQLGV